MVSQSTRTANIKYQVEQELDTIDIAQRSLLSDEDRELLKEAGYKMVHLCYFYVQEVQNYHYFFHHYKFFSKEKGKKICSRCKKRYGLVFPTVGFAK